MGKYKPIWLIRLLACLGIGWNIGFHNWYNVACFTIIFLLVVYWEIYLKKKECAK